MATLRFCDDEGVDQAIEVGPARPEVLIGRNPECALRTRNNTVSRMHAKVWWADGTYRVRDLDSANGTWCDRRKIKEVELEDGVELTFGAFPVSFALDADERRIGGGDVTAEVEAVAQAPQPGLRDAATLIGCAALPDAAAPIALEPAEPPEASVAEAPVAEAPVAVVAGQEMPAEDAPAPDNADVPAPEPAGEDAVAVAATGPGGTATYGTVPDAEPAEAFAAEPEHEDGTVADPAPAEARGEAAAADDPVALDRALSRIAELERALSDRDDSLARLGLQVDELSGCLAARDGERDDAVAQAAVERDARTAAEQALAQSEERLAAGQDALEAIRAEAEAARAEAEAARAEAEAARVALEEARASSTEDGSTLDAARAEADEARAALESARNEAEQARAALETARAEADEARAALESARNEAEQARAAQEAARAEADEFRAALESARNEASETRADLERARARIGDLEAVAGTPDALASEVELLRGKLEAARGELEAARAETDEARGALESAQGVAAQVRGELETARAEAAAAATPAVDPEALRAITAERDALLDETRRWDELKRAFETERSTLQAEVERLRPLAEAAATPAAAPDPGLAEQVASLTQALQEAQNEVATLRAANRAYVKRIAKLLQGDDAVTGEHPAAPEAAPAAAAPQAPAVDVEGVRAALQRINDRVSEMRTALDVLSGLLPEVLDQVPADDGVEQLRGALEELVAGNREVKSEIVSARKGLS